MCMCVCVYVLQPDKEDSTTTGGCVCQCLGELAMFRVYSVCVSLPEWDSVCRTS